MGIVFASLVNFNELYDESYMGGKEFLRYETIWNTFRKYRTIWNTKTTFFFPGFWTSLFLTLTSCWIRCVQISLPLKPSLPVLRFYLPGFSGSSKDLVIAQFDFLCQTEFRNVEKIKTIGATFMAASGLNPFIRFSISDIGNMYENIYSFCWFLPTSS